MEEQSMTFDDFRDIALRRKWSIIIPAVFIFGVAALLAVFLPRTYTSTSKILIEGQGIPREYVIGSMAGYAEQRLQSINQQVMSSTKLLEIIKRFNLYSDMKDKATTEDIVDRMRKDIKFEPLIGEGPGKVGIISFSLSYSGKTPTVVQQVASVLTSLYLEENLRVREEQASGTTQFLEDEMNSVQQTLAGLDGKIAAFKRRNLDALPELSQVNLQGADRLDLEIDRLNDQLRTLKEREGNLQTQLSGTSAELLDRDNARLKELTIQLVNLKSRFSDDYPDVIKVKSEIAGLIKQMQATGKDTSTAKLDNNPVYVSLESQLAGTRSEIDSVKRQIGLLNQRKGSYRRRIESSPRVEEEYKILSAQRNNLQMKFDDLMKKYMESKVAHGLEKGKMAERFTIIEPAPLPEKPVKPKVPAILFFGLVLGIGSGVGLAAVKEFSDQSVRTSEALSRATGFTVLAGIPEIASWQETGHTRTRWAVMIIAIVLTIVGSVLLFHFFVMDLDILRAKLSRRMGI